VQAGSGQSLWDRLKQHAGTSDGGDHRGSVYHEPVGEFVPENDGLPCAVGRPQFQSDLEPPEVRPHRLVADPPLVHDSHDDDRVLRAAEFVECCPELVGGAHPVYLVETIVQQDERCPFRGLLDEFAHGVRRGNLLAVECPDLVEREPAVAEFARDGPGDASRAGPAGAVQEHARRPADPTVPC
jgi:hypothetical protein